MGTGVSNKIDGELFVGANKRGDRIHNDFYPTPTPSLVLGALFSIWHPDDVFAWEPACGNGALCVELDKLGYTVFASDLEDRGYGIPGVDFLKVQNPPCTLLITNPPWHLAREFISAAKSYGVQRMALLLPTTFYNTVKGLESFRRWQPKIVAPLTWRLDFRNLGAPVQTCQWVIWDETMDMEGTEYTLLWRKELPKKKHFHPSWGQRSGRKSPGSALMRARRGTT